MILIPFVDENVIIWIEDELREAGKLKLSEKEQERNKDGVTRLFTWSENGEEVKLDEKEFQHLHLNRNLKNHSEEQKINLARKDMVFSYKDVSNVIACDFPSLKHLVIEDIHMEGLSKFGVTYYLPKLNLKKYFLTKERIVKFIQGFLTNQ